MLLYRNLPEKSCVVREICEIDGLAGTRGNQYFASVPKRQILEATNRCKKQKLPQKPEIIAKSQKLPQNQNPKQKTRTHLKPTSNKKQFTKLPPGCILKY
jgi:hypothetical protein